MICESVKLVGKLDDTDILLIKLSDGRSIHMLYPYNDALAFVGEEVICKTRKDLLNGQIVEMANVLTVAAEVMTVPQDIVSLKLYSTDANNHSTISFDDLAVGDTVTDAILYCTKTERGSSTRAEWLDVTCVDAKGKVRNVRMFSPDNNADFDSHYLKINITRTAYGFNSDAACISPMPAYESPDVVLAIQYIERIAMSDPKLKALLEGVKVIDRLRNQVYYDKGYYLVRIAHMMYLIDSMQQLTDVLDIVNCRRAIIVHHLYLCLAEEKWNRIISNFFIAKKYDIDEAIILSDYETPGKDINKRALKRVAGLADMLIKEKKGVLDS